MTNKHFNLVGRITFAKQGKRVVLDTHDYVPELISIDVLYKTLLENLDNRFSDHLYIAKNKLFFNAAAFAGYDKKATLESHKRLLRELERVNQLNNQGVGVEFAGVRGANRKLVLNMLSIIDEDMKSEGSFKGAKILSMTSNIAYCDGAVKPAGKLLAYSLKAA